MDKSYIDTVRLLLRVAPDVFEGDLFAMKGGTAINLFVRDMPRLSVDIDLVYVNHETPRKEALEQITAGLHEISERLEKTGLSARKIGNKEMGNTKLVIEDGSSMVKIEVNTVLRGTVLPIDLRHLTREASDLFLAELRVPTLALPELYGGKLVAALDRQHPRDLFDVFLLFENEGLTEAMVECFVIYLSGHDRPPHEVLDSRDKDISQNYQNQFEGMTSIPVTLDQLTTTRLRLRAEVKERLTTRQKEFLMSLLRAEPDWSLLDCQHASQLPGIQWKLMNLRKFRDQQPDAFEEQILKMQRILT
ncbi:MAG: nucleotidyl transferase AbiEii/AbiGii toxin family protein [Chthoniobacterales bacterium]